MQRFFVSMHCRGKDKNMKQLLILSVMLSALAFSGIGQTNAFKISGHFQYDRSFSAPWDECNTSTEFAPGGCYEPMVIYPTRFTFTAGADVSYQINREFEVFGGINYSQKRGYDYGIWFFCGTADPYSLPVNALYKYGMTQNFLEVPLGARFYMLPGNLKMHIEATGITSVPMVFNNFFPEEDILITGRLGYGVDYFLGPWQWSLNVNYGRLFQPITRDNQTNWEQNNLGIEVRTAFRLGGD